MKRLLVWFNSGLYREFPKCTKISFDRDYRLIDVTFGNDHYSTINMSNVDFYEILDEEG